MLFTIIAIMTALVSLSVHEIGHAYAMRECGVRVEAISLLGIRLRGLGTLRLPVKFRFFPGTEWRVHPLIVGAYVEPDEAGMKALSRGDALYVLGMGPLANILFSLVVVFVLAVLVGALEVTGVYPGASFLGLEKTAVLAGLITGGWWLRRTVCQFLLLPIGCLLLLYLVYAVFPVVGTPIPGISDLVAGIHELRGSADSSPPLFFEIVLAIAIGTALSVFLGLGNLLPFVPFDGGVMMRTLFPSMWRDSYSYVTAPFFVVWNVGVFWRDLTNLIRWLF